MTSELFRIQHHARLTSTNDEAKRLAAAGAEHGTVVWADEQTAGRGRYARVWDSPTGNLMFSVLLRPAVAPDRAAELAFVTAVVAAECIAALLPGGARVGLKWPNDVRIDGDKVAGILLEADSGDNSLHWVVLGTGINVAHAPTGLAYPATCLRAHRSDATPEQGLHLFLEHLARWLPRWEREGFAPVRAAWLARAEGLGSELTVTLGDREERGTFRDLDATGAMLLTTPEGTRRITAGDVAFAVS